MARLYDSSGLRPDVAERQSAPVVAPAEISSNSTEMLALGFSQLLPFLQIAKPFFQEDKVARNSLVGVAALTLLNSGISVAFSYISRDFYTALNARDEAQFYEKIELFFVALVVAVPVSVYYRFLREKLSLYWREALTTRVLEQYYGNRTYFVIETLRDIDNPDQRIADDIRQFTRTSLDFFITLFTSLIDLLSFSAILFQIYPGLFAAIILYAGAGSVITTKLGRSLVSLNYERLIKEANFRFGLIRTRENAEAIAFYDSSAMLEKQYLEKIFKEVLENQFGIIKVQRDLEFFTTAYRYLVQILPSLIVAPLFFSKQVELGAVTQSFGAFNHILGDFSIIINQFESLSAFSAGLTRLSTFLERINSTSSTPWDNGNSKSGQERKPLIDMQRQNAATSATAALSSDVLFSCRNLTVLTPDGNRVLIGGISSQPSEPGLSPTAHTRGVDIDVRSGDRVLIVGPSGSGKSSLIRALSGLWQIGSGSIAWSSNLSESSKVLFLPQKPYNVIGTLREQIMYPNHAGAGEGGNGAAADSLLLEVLSKVKLGDLARRMGDGDPQAGLGVSKDWTKTLSLGEQQRLAFSRVLFNKPQVVFLDESTSALDLNGESDLYLSLQELGVSYVSVGHRPSLLKFHSKKLSLTAGREVEMIDLCQGDECPEETLL